MGAVKKNGAGGVAPAPQVAAHSSTQNPPQAGTLSVANADDLRLNVPHTLRGLKAWLLWRWSANDKGKPTKVPSYANEKRRRGTQNESTDLAALVPFSEAMAVFSRCDRGFAGPGLALRADLELVAIDIDRKPHTPAPLSDEEAARVIAGTYAETSPSGLGVRAFFRGRMTDRKNHHRGVEVFSAKGFVTVTGQRLPDAPGEIAELTDERRRLLEALLAQRGDKGDDGPKAPLPHDRPGTATGLERVREAVMCLPAESYGDWILVGMALKRAFRHDPELDAAALELFTTWSTENVGSGDPADADECARKWREGLDTASPGVRPVTIGTIFWRAKHQHGWKPEAEEVPPDEAGNSRWLVRYHGDRFLATPGDTRDTVYTWAGTVWQEDSGRAELFRTLRSAEHYWRDRASGAGLRQEDRDRILAHAKACRKVPMIDAARKHVARELELQVRPDDFDTAPNLLACTNGVLDLETGLLLPHAAEHRLRRMVSVEWNPRAGAPVFSKFLRELCHDDQALMMFLRRVFGYVLGGHTDEQVLVFLMGPPASGKSTFLDALMHVLGSYAHTLQKAAVIAGSFGSVGYDLANLPGKRLAVVNELAQGEVFDSALLKQLSGQDAMTVRQIRGEPVTFQPRAKVVLVGNARPAVPAGDAAFWRRVLVIPMDHVVPAAQRDAGLREKLHGEAPGILRWLAAGYRSWRGSSVRLADPAGWPASVADATGSYQLEADPLLQWRTQCCLLAAGAREEPAALLTSYRTWTTGPAVTEHAFFQWLEAQGHGLQRSHGKRYRIGLQLKQS